MADYRNPIGPGLQSARIDMGVDYTGAGPLYALGSGTIKNVYNSGWPGGKFISLLLDSGPYAGKYVYYAENITPKVKVGQKVQAGQLIGTAVGSYPFIEVGWASGSGGQTMAAQAGEAATGGDPGEKSTAYGVSMSNLISSLGGKPGILTPGGITGSTAQGFPAGGSLGASPAQTTSATSDLLSGCVPLVGLVYQLVMFTRRHKKSATVVNRLRSGRNATRCRKFR